MSRNAFPQIERDYAEDQGYRELMREERRQIQRERMLEAQIQDAYEQIEQTTCCDMNEVNK